MFLRCESEELEEIDYRSDFPYSRLHITLYEGPDLEYAKSLYDEMKKQNWLIRMDFDNPKQLSKQTLGCRVPTSFDFERAYKDVLGGSYAFSDLSSLNNTQKLNQIRGILKRLFDYLKQSRAAPQNKEKRSAVPESQGRVAVHDGRQPACVLRLALPSLPALPVFS